MSDVKILNTAVVCDLTVSHRRMISRGKLSVRRWWFLVTLSDKKQPWSASKFQNRSLTVAHSIQCQCLAGRDWSLSEWTFLSVER